MDIQTIGPRRLYELWRGGQPIDVIDVRTPAEYREVHARPARPVPLDSLDPRAVMEARDSTKDEPLYIICRSGSRGRQACGQFLAAGCRNVVNVEGGTLAWEQAGLPVSRGKRTISLQCQVSVAAGLAVLLGAALGAYVPPYFLALAALAGLGLLVTGITGDSTMEKLLARMPWNRAGGAATCRKQGP